MIDGRWHLYTACDPMTRFRRRVILAFLLAFALSGCATIGYSLKPETIRTGKPQSLRLAVAKFVDSRPLEETDIFERERLIGDDARNYTNYGATDVGNAVSNVVVRHLAFSGAFREVGRVDLESDRQRDYLELEIKRLAGEFDAVMLGRVSHLWGFDGTNAEGDFRIVEGQAHLVELRIVRTRDLRLIWSGEGIANFRKVDYQESGNQYTIANNLLREALNKVVADLNKTRLPTR